MLYNVQEFFSLTHKGIRNKVGDMFGKEGEEVFDSAVVSITILNPNENAENLKTLEK